MTPSLRSRWVMGEADVCEPFLRSWWHMVEADVQTSLKGVWRPTDVMSICTILDEVIQDGEAWNDGIKDMRRVFVPLLVARLPFPTAILDDVMSASCKISWAGSGNDVIQDGNRKRKSHRRHKRDTKTTLYYWCLSLIKCCLFKYLWKFNTGLGI